MKKLVENKKLIEDLRKDIRRTIGEAHPVIAFAAVSQLQMLYAMEIVNNDAEKSKMLLQNHVLFACMSIDKATKNTKEG